MNLRRARPCIASRCPSQVRKEEAHPRRPWWPDRQACSRSRRLRDTQPVFGTTSTAATAARIITETKRPQLRASFVEPIVASASETVPTASGAESETPTTKIKAAMAFEIALAIPRASVVTTARCLRKSAAPGRSSERQPENRFARATGDCDRYRSLSTIDAARLGERRRLYDARPRISQRSYRVRPRSGAGALRPAGSGVGMADCTVWCEGRRACDCRVRHRVDGWGCAGLTCACSWAGLG